MTDYAFQANFAACDLGPMTTAQKQRAWPDSSLYTLDDPTGSEQFFSIVEDSRFAQGRACRMRYPLGSHGMEHQFYILRIKSPKVPANLEFDWLFEDGFDLWPPNSEHLGGGKIGPCINWGEVGGVTEMRGTRAMMWYNGNGSLYQNGKWSPSCQDQRSGDQMIKPAQYGPLIVTNQMYHIRIRIHGGDNGLAEYWIDDSFHATSIPGAHLQVTPDDDVLYDFAAFAGGGAVQAPRWDSYARNGTIRCWSGTSDTYPGQPPGAQQYRLEGTFTGTITPL
jgi:hypothetical protein